jgi:hypothetical protein
MSERAMAFVILKGLDVVGTCDLLRFSLFSLQKGRTLLPYYAGGNHRFSHLF